MVNKVFKVDKMSCEHCIKAIEMELKDLDLSSFSVNIGSVEVQYNPDRTSDKEIINAIEEAGYKVII